MSKSTSQGASDRDSRETEENRETRVAGPLREGVDYTLEDGLFVLTRDYLLRRGHCCGSGCRNCPYGESK